MGIGNPKGTNRGGGTRPGNKKYIARPDGEIWVEHKRKCVMLKGTIGNKGYRKYDLRIPDGKGGSKRLSIDGHRFIASQLLPNPYNLEQVDHINRVRHDNRVENLRWVSRSQNCDNRVFGGTTQQAIDYLEGLGYTIIGPNPC